MTIRVVVWDAQRQIIAQDRGLTRICVFGLQESLRLYRRVTIMRDIVHLLRNVKHG